MSVRQHHDLSEIARFEELFRAAMHESWPDLGPGDRPRCVDVEIDFQAAVVPWVIVTEVQSYPILVGRAKIAGHSDGGRDVKGIAVRHPTIVSLSAEVAGVGVHGSINQSNDPRSGGHDASERDPTGEVLSTSN